MAIEKLFDSASSVMTVVSFITFAGILWWAWRRSDSDLAVAANLPFADDILDTPAAPAAAPAHKGGCGKEGGCGGHCSQGGEVKHV